MSRNMRCIVLLKACVLLQAASLLQAAPVEHKTRFDSEIIPGVAGERVTFPLSNSRQVVRTPAGYWLLGFDIPDKGLFLCYGPPSPAEGSRFSQPVLLVGNSSKGLLAAGSEPAGLSFSIADRNLHIAWSDRHGVWLAFATIADEQHGLRKP